MSKTLTQIREQGNKEFEENFFELEEEYPNLFKEIKSHITQREDNIIKGVIEMLKGMKNKTDNSMGERKLLDSYIYNQALKDAEIKFIKLIKK